MKTQTVIFRAGSVRDGSPWQWFFVYVLFCCLPALLCAAVPPQAAPAGSDIPDVVVKTPADENFYLRRAATGLRTIICFYRGYWCPYGMNQLKEIRNVEEELDVLGFRIFAMSPDRPARVRQTVEEFGAGFVLLSDSKMLAARAMGISHQVSSTEWQQLRHYGIDLEFISEETHHQIPRPALFFIGRDGRILERFVPDKISRRMDSDEIVRSARRLLDRENISDMPR